MAQHRSLDRDPDFQVAESLFFLSSLVQETFSVGIEQLTVSMDFVDGSLRWKASIPQDGGLHLSATGFGPVNAVRKLIVAGQSAREQDKQTLRVG